MIGDGKELVSGYVAEESERLSKALKEIAESGHVPTNEEKDAILADMEETLTKITRALEYMTKNVEEELPVA